MSTIPTTTACHSSDCLGFGRGRNSLLFWAPSFRCPNRWFQTVIFKDKCVNRCHVPTVCADQSCTSSFFNHILDRFLFQKDGHLTNVPARDAKLVSVAARTRNRLHVHNSQSVLIVPTLDLETGPCVLMNTQQLGLLHGFLEHFCNFWRQPIDIHCLIFVPPSFEKYVELFNVR